MKYHMKWLQVVIATFTDTIEADSPKEAVEKLMDGPSRKTEKIESYSDYEGLGIDTAFLTVTDEGGKVVFDNDAYEAEPTGKR